MFFGLFGASTEIVGIDIGSRSIKLVQLKRVKEDFHLVHLGMAELPPESIVDHAIMDSVAVVDCIRSLVENQEVKTKNVAASVSGHSIIIRNIRLPVMTPEEVETSIEWEAEQYIPFEISEVNLDFQILGPDGEDVSHQKVLLVAAKKEFVDDYLAVLQECGLNPVVMDIDCFALENAYQTNYDQEEDVVALVNVGANAMNVNILRRGQSVFTRDIQSGGNAFNEEIQKRLGLTNEEAETAKLGGALPDVDPALVDLVVKESADNLAQEIQRSLDFFTATSSDAKVEKLYLCGGVAKTPGMNDILCRQLGIPIETLDPFRRIKIDENQFDMENVASVAPFLVIGVGLATRRLGDK
jgi:type IV pilus assembly protein PilM